MSGGTTLWRYTRNFAVDGEQFSVLLRTRTNGLVSQLFVNGALVADDHTPVSGAEAVRNHSLTHVLGNGAKIGVEAGYISSFNTGIAVRRDGELIHESHPGRTIAYPDKYREAALSLEGETVGSAIKDGWRQGMAEAGQADNYDPGVWRRNKIPLGVDIALGLLFFAVAKLTDLTTAALVGAACGIILLIAQRITKIDLLGGLAMFGIVMMLLSAGLALMFQSDEAVKYRTTALGLFSAALFFSDGLMGGKRLATRLMRYLPYTDIDAARLGIGMGVLGMVMAAANLLIALHTSTDIWLLYTTFGDFVLTMALIILVFKYARGELLRDTPPSYRPELETHNHI